MEWNCCLATEITGIGFGRINDNHAIWQCPFSLSHSPPSSSPSSPTIQRSVMIGYSPARTLAHGE